MMEQQKENIAAAEKSHKDFNSQMKSEFIPLSYQYAKELGERKAAKDGPGEAQVIKKQSDLKAKFNSVLSAAVSKNQIVQDELKKYLHKMFSFPINETVKSQFVKAYQKNIVNLGYLKKVSFPAPETVEGGILVIPSNERLHALHRQPQVQSKRILTTTTSSDLVYVTDLHGDTENAKIIDSNADTAPPIGVKKLDTSNLKTNFANLRMITILTTFIILAIFTLIQA